MDPSEPTSQSATFTENEEGSISLSSLSTSNNKDGTFSTSACPNCSKIAAAVRDWQAFEAFREPGMQIAPRDSFKAAAKDCQTCAKVEKMIESNSARWCDECGVVIRFGSGTLHFCNDYEHHHRVVHGMLMPPRSLDSKNQHYVRADTENVDLDQVQSWLSQCDSEHSAECHADLEDGLVHRLTFIDVYDMCIVTNTSRAKYSALSYVWGSAPPLLRAEKSNMEDLSHSGSFSKEWDKLPRTVQDAILLSKRLQIRYIWIDRFCIVQDDLENINENISAMALIYSQAYVTIIAADGPDPEFGLRGTGTQSGTRAFQEELTSDVFVFEDLEFISHKGRFESDQAWHTRAWTFQERVVSRRKLIFNRGMVKLECQEGYFHERLGLFESNQEGRRPPKNHWPDRGVFNRYAKEYAKRKLTSPLDAVNAFSAITSSLTSGFPGGFIWGLPVFYLDIALDWTHMGVGTRREGPPSWSYMGWEGPIETSLVWVSNSAGRCFYIPSAVWKVRESETKELVEITLDHFDKYEKYENEEEMEPPESWERVSSTESWGGRTKIDYKYIPKAGDDRKYPEKFAYPVPIAPLVPTPVIATDEPHLYVTTEKAVFTLGGAVTPMNYHPHKPIAICLYDASMKEQAGMIETNFGKPSEWTIGDECLVIAIYHGCTNNPSWLYPGEYQRYANAMETKDSPYSKGTTWDWVQVLWVEMKGGIAYRRGTGRVWARAWKNAKVITADIILG